MVREFASPVNVSPLIRISRWCMLLAGIGFGVFRHNVLQSHEDERRRGRESVIKMRNLIRPEPAEEEDLVVGSSRDDGQSGTFDLPRDNENGPSFDPITGPPDLLQPGSSDLDLPKGPTGPPEILPTGPKGSLELLPSGLSHKPLEMPPIGPNHEKSTVFAKDFFRF